MWYIMPIKIPPITIHNDSLDASVRVICSPYEPVVITDLEMGHSLKILNTTKTKLNTIIYQMGHSLKHKCHSSHYILIDYY